MTRPGHTVFFFFAEGVIYVLYYVIQYVNGRGCHPVSTTWGLYLKVVGWGFFVRFLSTRHSKYIVFPR